MLDARARLSPARSVGGVLTALPLRSAARATVPARTATAVWGVLLAGGLAFALSARGLLAARFSYDASHIAHIAQQGSAAGQGDQSFIAVGELYNVLRLQDQPVLTSVLSFAVLALLHTVVFSRLRAADRFPVVGLLLLLVSLGIGSVYLTTYAKDTVVLAVTTVCLLAKPRLSGEIPVVGALLVYAACFRSYWFLVVGIYVAVRLVDRFVRPRVVGVVAPAVLVLLAALAYVLVTGHPLDEARTTANSIRIGSADARTMITEWVSLPQPWGSLANTAITLLLLIVPIPLFAMGGGYYVVIGLLLLALWGSVIWAWFRRPAGEAGAAATRATALLLAFLATQSVFEPDYGSALRHLSPLLPLLALGVGLAVRRTSVEHSAVERVRTASRGRHAA